MPLSISIALHIFLAMLVLAVIAAVVMSVYLITETPRLRGVTWRDIRWRDFEGDDFVEAIPLTFIATCLTMLTFVLAGMLYNF